MNTTQSGVYTTDNGFAVEWLLDSKGTLKIDTYKVNGLMATPTGGHVFLIDPKKPKREWPDECYTGDVLDAGKVLDYTTKLITATKFADWDKEKKDQTVVNVTVNINTQEPAYDNKLAKAVRDIAVKAIKDNMEEISKKTAKVRDVMAISIDQELSSYLRESSQEREERGQVITQNTYMEDAAKIMDGQEPLPYPGETFNQWHQRTGTGRSRVGSFIRWRHYTGGGSIV